MKKNTHPLWKMFNALVLHSFTHSVLALARSLALPQAQNCPFASCSKRWFGYIFNDFQCIIHRMWWITNCIWFFMCTILSLGAPCLLVSLSLTRWLHCIHTNTQRKRNYASTQNIYILEYFIINANGNENKHYAQMLISNTFFVHVSLGSQNMNAELPFSRRIQVLFYFCLCV